MISKALEARAIILANISTPPVATATGVEYPPIAVVRAAEPRSARRDTTAAIAPKMINKILTILSMLLPGAFMDNSPLNSFFITY
jgi:hypothetical protein